MNEKQQITRTGVKKLEEELRELLDVTRPAVIEQLRFARSQGDLSENADYDAAKSRQAEVEGRISIIQDVLANAEIIDDNSDSDVIGITSIVKVRRKDTKVVSIYQIVGTIEARPGEVVDDMRRISNVSPLGSALMGHHRGETVSVHSPKPYSVTIEEIIKK